MEGPIIGLIVLACFFAVAFLVACYYIVDRLGGIEEGLEKISILMTVMAIIYKCMQPERLVSIQ